MEITWLCTRYGQSPATRCSAPMTNHRYTMQRQNQKYRAPNIPDRPVKPKHLNPASVGGYTGSSKSVGRLTAFLDALGASGGTCGINIKFAFIVVGHIRFFFNL